MGATAVIVRSKTFDVNICAGKSSGWIKPSMGVPRQSIGLPKKYSGAPCGCTYDLSSP